MVYLGKNKITQIENLSSLTNLKILSIQANRLRNIQGLEALTNLQEFYIADNGLENLEVKTFRISYIFFVRKEENNVAKINLTKYISCLWNFATIAWWANAIMETVRL